MAWTITSKDVGLPPITSLNTATGSLTQGATTVYPASAKIRIPGGLLGKIVSASDPTLGNGEFIFLKGVSSTVLGSIVRYDDGFQTALAATAVDVGEPNAVAMAACTGSYYGWYQIAGLAVAKKASATTFADGAPLGAAAGLAVAAVTNVQMINAIVRTVTTSTGAAANYVAIAINRPGGPGNGVAA